MFFYIKNKTNSYFFIECYDFVTASFKQTTFIQFFWGNSQLTLDHLQPKIGEFCNCNGELVGREHYRQHSIT